jgi:DNA topoisomerase-6 subunit B
MKEPIAFELSKKQREISVAEFFEKNKHLLGFDSPPKAIVTCVKEAVDNALDACEEAGILPDIEVKIKSRGQDKYEIQIEDNGPGIERRQLGPIFGKLLYGSRFYSIMQARGQQGIGISACVLYGQLTTGKPVDIESKIGEGYPAHHVKLRINMKKNEPEMIQEDLQHWEKPHGTLIKLWVSGRYVRGKQSVLEYLRGASLVNPHAFFLFEEPDGTKHRFDRTTNELPKKPVEIKPHPYGIELGRLIRSAAMTKSPNLSSFLKSDFSSIGNYAAQQIFKVSGLKPEMVPAKMSHEECEKLLQAFQSVEVMPPPTNCLSPIKEEAIRKSLKHEMQVISPEFIRAVTRPPGVWGGHPFQVEAGLVFGGKLPKEEPAKIMRFANRVPLLYQSSACAITQAISDMDWQRYGLQQPGKRGIPTGSAIFLVHIASTNVPFTSESKEAVAPIPEIIQEIKLALQECGRHLQNFMRKMDKRKKSMEKLELIQEVIPEIARKAADMVGKPVPNINRVMTSIMNVVYIGCTADEQEDRTLFRIKATNWTNRKREFNVYSIIPDSAKLVGTNPPPEWKKEKWIGWKVNSLEPGKYVELMFEVENLNSGGMEEPDIFVKGIDPVHLIGAEKWEGEG